MKYTTPWCMLMALIIQLLLASMFVLPGAESSEYYRRAELIHVDANRGFTREELIRRAAERAHLRAAMLSPADTQDRKMKVEAQYSPYEYLMPLEVDMAGKRQSFLAVADTGSEMVWMKWMEEETTTTAAVPCSCTSAKGKELLAFTKRYGNRKKAAKGFICTHRELSFKTKTVAENEPPKDSIDLGFAIHYDDDLLPEKAHGIVGLSRSGPGGYSLVDQLKFTKFSYCLSNPLTEEPPPNSPFWFGGDPIKGSKLKSTPLVEVSPQEDSSLKEDWYYVELLGISIDDGERKELPGQDYFKHKSKQGNGVMFIDSGCTHTFLETRVFSELMCLLVGKLGGSTSIIKDDKVHTCFPPDKAEKAPTLELHLDGEKMRIPRGNYLLQDKPESDFCLAIFETAGVSVLGNIQQHNIYMHYDLTPAPGKLSFKEDTDCSKLL